MTPIVLEQYGRTAPGAQAIFNKIIHHRLQLLVRQGCLSRTPKGSPALRSRAPYPAHCSEQFGRRTRSVHGKAARLILGTHLPSLPDSPGETE